MSESTPYLHGFDSAEQDRLWQQARFLAPYVFERVRLNGVRRLLEVGCGTGAQTELLLERYPELKITAIDREPAQLNRARPYFSARPAFHTRVEFVQMDAGHLEFPDQHFDGAWFIWVLEHVADPLAMLRETRRVLAPGGTVILTEVWNSGLFIHPTQPHLQAYWKAYNTLQEEIGGDPCVGVKLGHLLLQAGFSDIQVEPRPLLFDARHPASRTAIFQYWRDLLLSASRPLLERKLVSQTTVEALHQEFDFLARIDDSVFFYAFMQAHARA